MAFLTELPLVPGMVLQYCNPDTSRTVYYRINSLGFIENYYFIGTLESSSASILAEALVGDGWDVCLTPPEPLMPAAAVLANKSEIKKCILNEIVKDIIVDELLTPSI